MASIGVTIPTNGKIDSEPPKPTIEPPPAKLLEKQFFTIVAIDPNKAGLEVVRIMNGLLVELTRTMGSELRLTLEVEGASTEEVYPDDAVEIVKANAGDLKLGEESFGFEE